jgi:TRAP-type C4-dicarboxylate transport system permease small subunit
MNSRSPGILIRAGRLYTRVEGWAIVALTAFLTIFSLLQIILRDVFSTGFVWGDALTRHVVVWLGFLGASLATGEGRHIQIELLPKLLPPGLARAVKLFCLLFSALVSAVLAYASWDFLQNERASAAIAFANVPYWWLELIFPIGFTTMAFKFGWRFVDGLRGVGKDGPRP